MFSVGSYAKVWKITSHEKFTDIQCSTSQKKDGNYVTDFSGFVRLVGDAHRKAVELSEKDSIKIGNFGVTNSFSNGKNYTNIIMFDFEIKGQESNNNAADSDDELPFS